MRKLRSQVAIVDSRGLLGPPDLLAALERVFPVSFQVCGIDTACRMNGAVVLSDHAATLKLRDSGVMCLHFPSDRRDQEGAAKPVSFSTHVGVDARLRGKSLPDDEIAECAAIHVGEGEEVLAHREGAPVWVRNARGAAILDVSAGFPPLGSSEPLKAHLRLGRCFTLLVLTQFLREAARENLWTPPPLRASFIFDDPNLHSTSYGHIKYRSLIGHARRHGYHAAMATVPLDGWHVSRRAAQLFQENVDSVSLLIHGNNHSKAELSSYQTYADATASLGQALSRVRRLELRAGVPISRVMIAPHERDSDMARAAMLELGFEALCISRRYPWTYKSAGARSVAGWEPAELFPDAVTELPRHHLTHPHGELIIRAFLDQPLIIYGHQQDLKDGPERLESWTQLLHQLGCGRWCSLAEIAKTRYATRQDGSHLAVRMHSRRVEIKVPETVDAMAVEIPMHSKMDPRNHLTVNGTRVRVEGDGRWTCESFKVVPGSAVNLELKYDPRSDLSVNSRLDVRALGRRLLSEGRDRALSAKGGTTVEVASTGHGSEA